MTHLCRGVTRAARQTHRGTRRVLFIAWARTPGRSHDIAAAFGGRAVCLWPRRLSGTRRTPLRWAWSAAATLVALARERPTAVIATNPPVFPGFLALAYGRITGARVVLDSHPAAFGRKGARAAAWLLPAHRWLARRADAVLVTTEDWVREIQGWGGRALVVHEAPAEGAVPLPAAMGARPRILFVGVFAGDEPVTEVVEAARALPDCDVVVTGEVDRAPAGLVASSPPNVSYVGFLDQRRYADELGRADIVLTLTTEPTSVVRAGYEAVYAQRPLVVTDWPVLRETFPDAVHVANDAPSIARGLRDAISSHAELVAAAPDAATRQRQRWVTQRRALADVIGVDMAAEAV
jgi:hypothetical protein